MTKNRIGIIGRADNTGLGVETWEFCRHFDVRPLILSLENHPELATKYKTFPERFKNPIIVYDNISDDELKQYLKGLDVLFTIETPYNPNTYKIAREMGVKTVLRVNYEWLRKFKYPPDLYISPSLYHFNDIPDPVKYVPFPINRDVLPFKLRKRAMKFIHIAGNMKAGYDRNGTELFLQAIPLIKSNIEIIIKSQVPIECGDPRVRVDVCDYENYWDIWEDADVYVSPRRYAGQSLPLNEAMSRGMAIIMTDMEPQNEFLPTIFTIPVKCKRPLMIAKEIEIADIDPQDIADRIDFVAHQDITKYSKISDHIAEEWSWKKLKPRYLKIFKNLCS